MSQLLLKPCQPFTVISLLIGKIYNQADGTYLIDSSLVCLASWACNRMFLRMMSWFSLSTLALPLSSASIRFISFLWVKSAWYSIVAVRIGNIIVSQGRIKVKYQIKRG